MTLPKLSAKKIKSGHGEKKKRSKFSCNDFIPSLGGRKKSLPRY
jgi:hypothetical protein